MTSWARSRAPVGRPTDDLQVGLSARERGERGAQKRLILGDEHSDGTGHRLIHGDSPHPHTPGSANSTPQKRWQPPLPGGPRALRPNPAAPPPAAETTGAVPGLSPNLDRHAGTASPADRTGKSVLQVLRHGQRRQRRGSGILAQHSQHSPQFVSRLARCLLDIAQGMAQAGGFLRLTRSDA